MAAAVLLAAANEKSPPNYQMRFDNFKTKYGKVYSGIDEKSVRFENFKANDGTIRPTSVPVRRSHAGGVRCHQHGSQAREFVE